MNENPTPGKQDAAPIMNENPIPDKQDAAPSKSRFFQVMEVVIPVCTFVLGYGLSSWDKYLDKQDQLRNIEYILLTELGQNLGHLASIQRPQGRTEPLPPDLVSLIAQKLSFDVFKAETDKRRARFERLNRLQRR